MTMTAAAGSLSTVYDSLLKPPESTRDSGNCNVIGFTTYVKSVLGLLQDRILCIAS